MARATLRQYEWAELNCYTARQFLETRRQPRDVIYETLIADARSVSRPITWLAAMARDETRNRPSVGADRSWTHHVVDSAFWGVTVVLYESHRAVSWEAADCHASVNLVFSRKGKRKKLHVFPCYPAYLFIQRSITEETAETSESAKASLEVHHRYSLGYWRLTILFCTVHRDDPHSQLSFLFLVCLDAAPPDPCQSIRMIQTR